MNPLFFSRSCALVSFLEKRLVLASETPRVSSVSSASPIEEARVVAPLPGCFTMPKLLLSRQYTFERGVEWRSVVSARGRTYMDFLCGWTLHDRVLPSSTLTQRTMYDWQWVSPRTPMVGLCHMPCCEPPAARCRPFSSRYPQGIRTQAQRGGGSGRCRCRWPSWSLQRGKLRRLWGRGGKLVGWVDWTVKDRYWRALNWPFRARSTASFSMRVLVFVHVRGPGSLGCGSRNWAEVRPSASAARSRIIMGEVRGGEGGVPTSEGWGCSSEV